MHLGAGRQGAVAARLRSDLGSVASTDFTSRMGAAESNSMRASTRYSLDVDESDRCSSRNEVLYGREFLGAKFSSDFFRNFSLCNETIRRGRALLIYGPS
jgi:hypothetical protein